MNEKYIEEFIEEANKIHKDVLVGNSPLSPNNIIQTIIDNQSVVSVDQVIEDMYDEILEVALPVIMEENPDLTEEETIEMIEQKLPSVIRMMIEETESQSETEYQDFGDYGTFFTVGLASYVAGNEIQSYHDFIENFIVSDTELLQRVVDIGSGNTEVDAEILEDEFSDIAVLDFSEEEAEIRRVLNEIIEVAKGQYNTIEGEMSEIYGNSEYAKIEYGRRIFNAEKYIEKLI